MRRGVREAHEQFPEARVDADEHRAKDARRLSALRSCDRAAPQHHADVADRVQRRHAYREVGTCKRVPPPYLMWLAFVTAMFFVVVFGLAALFGNYVALVPLGIALVGLVAAWRAYGWLRFTRFDHRSIRLRARRPSYARALADRNGGRVL